MGIFSIYYVFKKLNLIAYFAKSVYRKGPEY